MGLMTVEQRIATEPLWTKEQLMKRFLQLDIRPPHEFLELGSEYYSRLGRIALGQAGIGTYIPMSNIRKLAVTDKERATVDSLRFAGGHYFSFDLNPYDPAFQMKHVPLWADAMVSSTLKNRDDVDEAKPHIDILSIASSTLLPETRDKIVEYLKDCGYSIGEMRTWELACGSTTAALLDSLHRQGDQGALHVVLAAELMTGLMSDRTSIGTIGSFGNTIAALAFRPGTDMRLLSGGDIYIDYDKNGVIKSPLPRYPSGKGYVEELLPPWIKVKNGGGRFEQLVNGYLLALGEDEWLTMDGLRTLALFTNDKVLAPLIEVLIEYHQNYSKAYKLGPLIGHQPSYEVLIKGVVKKLLENKFMGEGDHKKVANGRASRIVDADEATRNAQLRENGLPEVYWVMDNGKNNASAATSIVALQNMGDRGIVVASDTIAYPLLGLGAGMDWMAALVEIPIALHHR